jgi:serine/threonine protein kinase
LQNSENYSIWHEWLKGQPPVPDFIGPYKILKRLGSDNPNSQGCVYHARFMNNDQDVAIKVLGDPLESFENSILSALIGADSFAELRKEADNLTKIDHPNIVRIVDSGEDQHHGAYLAMEWISSGSLRDQMIRDGILTMPLPNAISIIKDVLSALEATHAVGLLHRDVKPENILLDEQKKAYLTDFGIAFEFGETFKALAGRGTEGYMAPEQRDVDQIEKIGPYSDVYSVGVVLFEMLLGYRPGRDELVERRLDNLAPKVVKTITRATEVDFRKRFQSASEMLSALADPF